MTHRHSRFAALSLAAVLCLSAASAGWSSASAAPPVSAAPASAAATSPAPVAPSTPALGLLPPPAQTVPAPGGKEPLLTPEQKANELGEELKEGIQNQTLQQARARRLPQYLFQADGTPNPQIKVKPDPFAAAPPVWQALNAWRRPR